MRMDSAEARKSRYQPDSAPTARIKHVTLNPHNENRVVWATEPVVRRPMLLVGIYVLKGHADFGAAHER